MRPCGCSSRNGGESSWQLCPGPTRDGRLLFRRLIGARTAERRGRCLCLFELFLGESKAGKVRETVENPKSIYTPDTVLAETSRKYLRENMVGKIVGERLSIVQSTSGIVHVTAELAIAASWAYLELYDRVKKQKLSSPSLFDGIVLGATGLKGATVLTEDPHFKDLAETIWI